MLKEVRRKEARNINKKSIIISCIQWILILVIVFCLTKIIIWIINSKEDSKKNNILSDQVVKIYTNTNVDVYTHEEKEETSYVIDFDKLKEINNDVVGWILIDGTNINYPILHSCDNDYYLHRNYLKEYSQSGSIFLDFENRSVTDNNAVIYGHNMSDGLMFHQLSRIYNGELGNNVDVRIITKDSEYIYSVFSTYMIYPNDFENGKTFDSLKSKSNINFKYGDIDKNKIITLYTCNSIGDKRIIVHLALCNTTSKK